MVSGQADDATLYPLASHRCRSSAVVERVGCGGWETAEETMICMRSVTPAALLKAAARCTFFDSNLHSGGVVGGFFTRLLRLKRCHARREWHSSRVFIPLTSRHCKFRLNTQGRPIKHQPTALTMNSCRCIDDVRATHQAPTRPRAVCTPAQTVQILPLPLTDCCCR
jgi:hypothetical protein